jgi:hypothetical protein
MLMVLCYASLGIENPSIKPSDRKLNWAIKGRIKDEYLYENLMFR